MDERLRREDLGLLPVLHDLLRTRSTTETARQLRCTQSTVSHALARLRLAFEDPLLVRVGRTMAPTRFAEALAPRLDAAMSGLSSLYSEGPAFSPATLERSFHFAGTDFSEALLLPGVVGRLSEQAPRVDLVCSATGADIELAIQQCTVDLAFGTVFRDRAGVVVKKIGHDDLALVLRPGHPFRNRLDAKRFASLGHVLVAPRGSPGGAIDVALAELGLTRRVLVRVRNFTTALSLVAKTDLVTSVPRRFAVRLAETYGVVVRGLPLPSPRFEFSLAWNEQYGRDPAHRWFRELVGSAATEVFGGRRPR